MPRGSKLSERQRRFVEAYTGPAEGNASEAARMAGYAKPGQEGHRLLKHAEIAEAVVGAFQQVRQEAIADREERQRMLTEIARGEATEYHVTKEGEVVETYTNPGSRLRAIETLGKMQGDFVERHEVNHSGAVRVFYPDNGRGPGEDEGDG